MGGEFRSASQEADYRGERLAEDVRHVRLVFLAAALINILFYCSDWRLRGLPHFPIAMAARTGIVAVSFGCLALAGRIRTVGQLEGVGGFWAVVVGLASAVLVSPGSDAALLVVFILPLIFFLCLPMGFVRVLAIGVGCSGLALGAYMTNAPDAGTFPGLLLGMATLQTVLALVVRQSNRLHRLQWSATRSEQAANQELNEHRLTLRTLLRAIPVPLIILDKETGRLVEANVAARTAFGNGVVDDPLAAHRALGKRELRRLAAVWPSSGQMAQFETRLHLPGGVRRDVLLVTTSARLRGGEALLAIVVDITNRKQMEGHLRRLATTDSLTGLLNRAQFFQLAAVEIARANRHGQTIAVIMFDLDYFKNINDTCGHRAGDRALRAVAGLCRRLARQSDLVARVGGEEFALLLSQTEAAGGVALGERLRSEIEAIRLSDLPLSLTVSVGVATVRPKERGIELALIRADQAMYAAKQAGRNRVRLYDPDLAAEAEDRSAVS